MFAKTFRNTLIASTLIIAGAALATPANAQLSDNVPLSGPVASTTAIVAAPTNAATALILGGVGTAQTDVVVNVARLNIWSNNTAGVIVTATGAGSLTNPDAADVVAYQVRIGAVGVAPATGDFTALSHNVNVVRDADGLVDGVAARDLFIKYNTPSVLGEGTYSSSIDVTVADL